MGEPGDQAWSSDLLAARDGRPWDLLVVGGGTAGLTAAHTAAELGASTLLVERARTGGECLWTGCVPSKALLASAHAAAAARHATRLGVEVSRVGCDFAAVMAHVRSAIAALEPVDSPAALRDAGVSVAHGTLHLTGPRSAEVDGTRVGFTRAVLATGSAPVVPDVPGLAEASPLTTDTVWGLTELPRRLLVVGGGSIGCELAQAFARLGSQVILVETAARLLPGERPGASTLVRAALESDGVDVRTATTVESVESIDPDRPGRSARLSGGEVVGFDRVLLAAGRRSRTAGLGLAAAQVEVDRDGHVVTDRRLRTSNPRIWAAGDVTALPAYTHVAAMHASIAAANAVLGLRRTVDTDLVPRVTYTQPEVASFGPTGQADGLTVWRHDHRELDRAVAEGCGGGFSEVLLDRRHRVVGATVVGPRAGEVLAEPLLAARERVPSRRYAEHMHAYPTWTEAPWRAVVEQARAQLDRPVLRGGIGALRAVRRRT